MLQIIIIIFVLFIVLVEDCNPSKYQEELEFSEDIIKDLKGLGLDE